MSCHAGEVCLFKDVSYNGSYEDWVNNDLGWGSVFQRCAVLCGLNDGADSVDNDGRQCGSGHFKDRDYLGASFWLNRGAANANLGGIGFGNVLSSHRWC